MSLEKYYNTARLYSSFLAELCRFRVVLSFRLP